MSQPPAMTADVRRTLVRQLIEKDPTLSSRKIGVQLGVGKDAILRDLEAIRQEDAAAKTPPAVAEPQPAPDDGRLVLVLDEPLRQALAVLRATRARPDNPRENVAAARGAILALADHFTEQARS
ncbi:hypothetical protein LZP81_30915 [Streptomyces parvulus]|uniref:hypothetical protein n=1 Tax=Streptomyces parvulus TaxID=146923 RepID=UPI001E2C0300|nr:hypothetical protein [Streptomyces parvulus]MCC9154883.1 hypothetical protein [Streptomyces parvulus]MCE7691272.1 hypothetical protein [Streptomyces parvulus]